MDFGARGRLPEMRPEPWRGCPEPDGAKKKQYGLASNMKTNYEFNSSM